MCFFEFESLRMSILRLRFKTELLRGVSHVFGIGCLFTRRTEGDVKMIDG